MTYRSTRERLKSLPCRALQRVTWELHKHWLFEDNSYKDLHVRSRMDVQTVCNYPVRSWDVLHLRSVIRTIQRLMAKANHSLPDDSHSQEGSKTVRMSDSTLALILFFSVVVLIYSPAEFLMSIHVWFIFIFFTPVQLSHYIFTYFPLHKAV